METVRIDVQCKAARSKLKAEHIPAPRKTSIRNCCTYSVVVRWLLLAAITTSMATATLQRLGLSAW